MADDASSLLTLAGADPAPALDDPPLLEPPAANAEVATAMYAPPAQVADAAPQYGQDSYGNIYVMSAPAGGLGGTEMAAADAQASVVTAQAVPANAVYQPTYMPVAAGSVAGAAYPASAYEYPPPPDQYAADPAALEQAAAAAAAAGAVAQPAGKVVSSRRPSTKGKQGWTREEDMKIVQYVQLTGQKWAVIAALLPGRTDDAVRNRYLRLQKKKNAGEPLPGEEGAATGGNKPLMTNEDLRECDGKKKGDMWTVEEDTQILEAVMRYGQKWQQISEHVPGRSANAVRNRFLRCCSDAINNGTAASRVQSYRAQQAAQAAAAENMGATPQLAAPAVVQAVVAQPEMPPLAPTAMAGDKRSHEEAMGSGVGVEPLDEPIAQAVTELEPMGVAPLE